MSGKIVYQEHNKNKDIFMLELFRYDGFTSKQADSEEKPSFISGMNMICSVHKF